jgi:hypothetical protein
MDWPHFGSSPDSPFWSPNTHQLMMDSSIYGTPGAAFNAITRPMQTTNYLLGGGRNISQEDMLPNRKQTTTRKIKSFDPATGKVTYDVSGTGDANLHSAMRRKLEDIAKQRETLRAMFGDEADMFMGDSPSPPAAAAEAEAEKGLKVRPVRPPDSGYRPRPLHYTLPGYF